MPQKGSSMSKVIFFFRKHIKTSVIIILTTLYTFLYSYLLEPVLSFHTIEFWHYIISVSTLFSLFISFKTLFNDGYKEHIKEIIPIFLPFVIVIVLLIIGFISPEFINMIEL